MKFLALLSAAAAVKVASKSKAMTKKAHVTELLQGTAEVNVDTEAGCTDWDDLGETDVDGDGCAVYWSNSDWCGGYDDDDFFADIYCCACGGGMPDWY